MKYYILWFLCVFTTVVSAQETLTGVVLDNKNKPLELAMISWQGTTIDAETDVNGAFTIQFVPNAVLEISYVGFELKHMTDFDQFNNVVFVLEPELALNEIVIKANQENTQRSLKVNTNTMTMNSGELLKAACCNLAESFETNPAIDVNFSDAISGSKQIKMLGLTSPYILIAEENIPTVRGASQAYGLSFTPGTWVESIQITKGAGSVVNGFESISGQINTELIKPATDIPFFLNLYGSTDSRFEVNAHLNQKVNKKWSTSLFVHGNARVKKNDMNHDGFLDNPLGSQINVMNRWQYIDPEKGLVAFISARYMKDEKQTGQLDFDPKTDRGTTKYWGSEINTEKFDFNAKVGYVFPDMPFQSIGWQNSFSYHDQKSYFGLNEYNISQRSFFSNLIFSSIINNTMNKFSTGLNFVYDDYNEYVFNYAGRKYDRIDNSVGMFFEYTYDNGDNFALVLGGRLDNSNRLGFFGTPRAHLRYNPWDRAVIRASAGRGKRVANIFAENQYLFASSRKFNITPDDGKDYDMNPEIAWNYGISFSQGFDLFDRNAEIAFDIYRTDFVNQIVVDIDQSAHAVNFYNLEGKSYANSFQVDLTYNLAKHLNLRTAYKYYDIKTQYREGALERPLQAKNRVFVNLEYQTHESGSGGSWKFDATWNWLGKQRLPYTGDNLPQDRLPNYTNPFSTINAQITKIFNERFEIYVGGENISNYRQKRVILGADDPFGPDFDSTIVYGPIFGQMYYAGLRFKIK